MFTDSGSEQFAKKLMGQLAFLYFLQKKGWLGVKAAPHELTEKDFKDIYYRQLRQNRELFANMYMPVQDNMFKLKNVTALDDTSADIFAGCFKGSDFEKKNGWGSGTKTFIRDIFTHCTEKLQKNFFDEYLEPLFYDALNKRRGDNHYYKRFNCKIPFLNGGLFDPLENYDWNLNKFEIPNDLFSNISIKGKDDADGILDIFDRYNFTMNEDEPLEKEVAVDPEMLGKIFENLLDIKDRKSKGAYYTPREIVHYMCQESIINYLVNKVDVPYEDMKAFILYGELMKDEDCSAAGRKDDYEKKIPQSVYNKLPQIDKTLENVKIADPAVGSGAFPLGMLNEIVKARMNITEYFVQQISPDKSYERVIFRKSRHPYKIKWETIKNCIFAVDIEHSAVDIAKLRLWLSLVVEQDIDEENPYPHALPNLDCNIMCGNSLIDESEGIKLFDESLLIKKEHDAANDGAHWQLSFFEDQVQTLTEELFTEQDRLFGEDDPVKKRQIKEKIDELIDSIIKMKLSRDKNKEGLEKYEETIKRKTKPYFLWYIEFGKIFKENGGFDIVIGNPPYGAELSKEDKKIIKANLKNTNNLNTAAIFIDYASSYWIKDQGIMSFIVPKSLLYSEKWFSLVKFMVYNTSSIVDVEKAFEQVKLEQVVFVYNSKIKRNGYIAEKFINNEFTNRVFIDNNLALKFSAWLCDIKQSELDIISNISSNVIKLNGISTTKRGVGLQKYITDDGDIPVIGGKNIRRFYVDGTKGYVDKDTIRANSKKITFMQQPKIISQDLVAHVQNPKPHIVIMSTFDEKGEILGVDTVQNTVLTSKDYDYRYILAILNSNFINWYTYKFIFCSAIRTMHFDSPYIGKIIIPKISLEEQQPVIDIVFQLEQCIDDAERDVWSKKLNNAIYKLYGLTEEEIKIIEEA